MRAPFAQAKSPPSLRSVSNTAKHYGVKTGENRYVPILPELAHELRTYVGQPTVGYLFETNRATLPLTQRDHVYECAMHCSTQGRYRHVPLSSKHLARPQAEEETRALADNTRTGVVRAGSREAGIVEVFTEASYEVRWYNRSEMGMQRGLARLRVHQATWMCPGGHIQEAANIA